MQQRWIARTTMAVAAIGLLATPAIGQTRRAALENSCNTGDAAACTRLGNIVQRGAESSYSDGSPNPRAAMPLFEKACQGGHQEGCQRLADLYARGEATPKNLPRAIELYTSGCEKEHSGSCFALSGLYDRGEGVERDPARSAALNARGVSLVTASCGRGNADDCAGLGVFYTLGRNGVTKDVALGVRHYDHACEMGDSSACGSASDFYWGRAPGLSPFDRARAAAIDERLTTLLTRECEGGNLQSCAGLHSARADYLACEFGEPGACFQAGQKYEPGHDFDGGDVTRAIFFYVKGCDAGGASLCTKVADFYTAGRWLPADPDRAASFRARAEVLKRQVP